MTSVSNTQLDNLTKENEEFKELAASRLQEIEKLNEEKAQAVNEIDKLKMEVSVS